MLEAGQVFFSAHRYFISPITLILGFEESGMKSIKLRNKNEPAIRPFFLLLILCTMARKNYERANSK